jgi:hypothetical protein
MTLYQKLMLSNVDTTGRLSEAAIVVLSYHAVDWAKKSNGKYFHPEFEL